MSHLRHTYAATTLLVLGLLAPQFDATAGVIRHDRPDSSYQNLAGASQFSGVGDLTYNTSTGGSRCSGTVINANWVLTAAHCVDDPGTTFMNFNVGTSYSALNWFAHPNWTGDLTEGWDIALIEFADDITGVEIAELYTGSSELSAVGTNVGFGRTGTGLTGDTGASGTKRAGENVIDTTGASIGWSNRILLQDFDNPTNAGDSVFGSSSPLDLEYLTAPGDSGGGLFIEEGSDWFLAGVHSLGASYDGTTDSDYGDLSGSTQVSAFVDWINASIGATNSTVPLPGSLALTGLGLMMLRLSRGKAT